MFKVFKKIVTITMAITICTLALVGCGKGKQTGVTPIGGKEGLLKSEAVMSMYLLGDQPRDYTMVLGELNKLIKAALNATLNVVFLPWGDYVTKYPLLIASGEKFDLIYTSSWAFYKDEVIKDAFLPLNELLPQYAKQLWSEMPTEAWKQATYKDKIYMVPMNYKDYTGTGFMIRGDLRKKYGVPEIKNLDGMELYMDAILANEKQMIPYNAGAWDRSLLLEAIPWKNNVERFMVDGVVIDNQDPEKVFLRHRTQEYKDFVKKMYTWQQKGFWSKSVLSNKTSSRDSFYNGKSAVTILNINNAQLDYIKISKQHPDWEVEYFDFDDNKPQRILTSYINDGMAVNRNAANPERAVMLLDKLHNDERYYNLTTYGILGKHYDVNSDGKLVIPPGVNAADNGFPPDSACPWGWRETKFHKTSDKVWPYMEAKKKEVFDKKAAFSPSSGFIPNKEPISSQLAALTQTLGQYQAPLLWGMVNPDEGLELLDQRLIEAGSEKVINEIQTQWSVYLKSQK